jgi:hypothetical protein
MLKYKILFLKYRKRPVLDNSIYLKLKNRQKSNYGDKIRIVILVWCYDSNGKAPALQVQSPEFKSLTHQKKKNSDYLL